MRIMAMKELIRNNKYILSVIEGLQIVYIALFFTNGIGIINGYNIYLGFAIYTVLSLVCFLLSVWLVLPFSECDNALKFLLLFISIVQLLFTIFIYLLPECGIPAPIQLW